MQAEHEQNRPRDSRGVHRALRAATRAEPTPPQQSGGGAHRALPSPGSALSLPPIAVGLIVVLALIVGAPTGWPVSDEPPVVALPNLPGPPPGPPPASPAAGPAAGSAPVTPGPKPRPAGDSPTEPSAPAAPPSPTSGFTPRTGGGRTSPPPARRPASRPPEARPAQAAPVTADLVSGTFRVVDTFSESFIGEVMIGNSSGRAITWQVTMRFSDDVADLRSFWVDGSPPPAVRRTGQTVVFTGATPVSPGASAPLRFLFARTGGEVTPVRCTVNDVRCRGTN